VLQERFYVRDAATDLGGTLYAPRT
jgi:hypothetical protein